MKNFLNSCWKTSARFSKLYLRVQVTFEGDFFKKLCKFSLSFLHTDWFILNFAWIFSAGFPQLSSTCQRIFSRNNVWCRNFFFNVFGFEGNLSDFRRQLFGSVVKIAFFVRAEQIEGSVVLKKCMNLNNFGTSR